MKTDITNKIILMEIHFLYLKAFQHKALFLSKHTKIFSQLRKSWQTVLFGLWGCCFHRIRLDLLKECPIPESHSQQKQGISPLRPEPTIFVQKMLLTGLSLHYKASHFDLRRPGIFLMCAEACDAGKSCLSWMRPDISAPGCPGYTTWAERG